MALCETCQHWIECGNDDTIKCPFYIFERETKGSDKPHHFARSSHHQPNHLRAVKQRLVADKEGLGEQYTE